ncbi:ABC transporter permease [Lacrimispora defluvii]|uniref:ABC transporter permease n=1 Tax=Lacrimispora defluvii TaxID=2719233 RepID=A0ABX1VK91_9FIRM|nr:ABC transporter permease [Lacrimispora defluvii]NNJ28630.1 ABC transporter permease [Lacrimispora defluvii]
MKKKKSIQIVDLLCKVLSIVLFLIIWQILVMANVQRPLMFGNLPTPVRVFQAFAELLVQQEFYYHVGYSCLRILIGCGMALPAGVFFGMVIGMTRFGKNFILPVFDMLRPIPQITWIPISILLFTTIEGSIIFITFIGAFFPILVNTIAGTETVSQTLLDAAYSMHAKKGQVIRYVYFPSAVPNIFTGLSVGIGTSWMSVIAAEMISGKYGIGYFTWMSYNLMNYADTIVGMITIGIIGLLCFVLIRRVESIVLSYREK